MNTSRARAHQLTSDQGVVLRRVPYRDNDLILTYFTAQHGKIGVLARSGRKSQKRFGGSLQAFVLADLDLAIREGADLAELRQAQVVETFARLSADPMQLGRAAYITELVDVLQRDHDPSPEVLDLLLSSLRWLDQSPAKDAARSSAILRGFEMRLLDILGLWPDHARCQRCGTDLNVDTGRQDPNDLRGLLCNNCGETKIAPQEFMLLQSRDLDTWVTAKEWTPALSLALGRRCQSLIRPLLNKPLRSLNYLRQMQNNMPAG